VRCISNALWATHRHGRLAATENTRLQMYGRFVRGFLACWAYSTPWCRQGMSRSSGRDASRCAIGRPPDFTAVAGAPVTRVDRSGRGMRAVQRCVGRCRLCGQVLADWMCRARVKLAPARVNDGLPLDWSCSVGAGGEANRWAPMWPAGGRRRELGRPCRLWPVRGAEAGMVLRNRRRSQCTKSCSIGVTLFWRGVSAEWDLRGGVVPY